MRRAIGVRNSVTNCVVTPRLSLLPAYPSDDDGTRRNRSARAAGPRARLSEQHRALRACAE